MRDERAAGTDATAVMREALWRCLRTVVDPEAGLAALPEMGASLPVKEAELEGALIEILDDDSLIGVLAARMLLIQLEDRTDWRSLRLFNRCQDVLNNVLRNGEREARMWACLMLQHETPVGVVQALQELQQVADRELRVLAAAALVETNGCDATTMSLLREALTADNDAIVATAAAALVRLGVWNDAAIGLLTEALRRRTPLRPMPILEVLKHVGATARKLAPAIAPLIMDESLSVVERRLAAVALGSITRGTDDGLPALEKALSAADWRIVAGAAEGLALSGQTSPKAVTRLVALTSSTDADVRRTAYQGLRNFGPRAFTAAPVLVARIGQEPDAELLDEVIRAVVAMGGEAIAPLVELLRGGDPRTVRVAEIALTAIAEEQPVEVLETLLLDRHPQIRVWASKIATELREDAAPAVLRLTTMLEEATEDERADDILVVIACCGPLDDATSDAVVRSLLRWKEIPQEWAQRWLPCMGPAIGLAIERARETATEEQRFRLETLAQSVARVEVNQFQDFAGIDLLLIETFCCVGEVLRSRGPTSWPELLKTLTQNPPSGPLVPLDLDIDPRTLGKRVKELAEALGTVLTDESQRRRGGLTDNGLQMLEKCKAYRQALKARRAMDRRDG